MKIYKILFVILLCFSLAFSTGLSVGADTQEENSQSCIPPENICNVTIEEDFSVDTILVTIRHEYSDFQRDFFPSDFPEIQENIVEIDNSEKLDPTKDYPMLDVDNYKKNLTIKLNTSTKMDVLECIKKIEKNPLIFKAHPEFLNCKPTLIPNDALYDSQRIIMNNIKAPAAWEITTGSNVVKVGVIDSGVLPHPDLANNLLPGYDFVNNNTVTNDDGYYYSSTATSFPSHGTAVAGQIAAIGNNDIGVAGIAWNVKIVPLQVFSDEGNNFPESAIIDAIEYAATNNIPIINISLVGYYQSDPFEEAIRQYKGLVVCTADNKALDMSMPQSDTGYYAYPTNTNLDNVITVASVTENDVLAFNSGYGVNSVDIAAPGSRVNLLFACSESEISGPYYSYEIGSGTSFAAPLVAGAAALLKSYNRTLNGHQLRRVILDNVDVLSSLNGKVATSGRLNVKKALDAVFPTERSRDYRFEVKVGAHSGISYFYFNTECDLSLCNFEGSYSGTAITDPSYFGYYFNGSTRVADTMYTGSVYPITQSGSIANIFYSCPFRSTSPDYFPSIYITTTSFTDLSNNEFTPPLSYTTVLLGDTDSDGDIDSNDATNTMGYVNGSSNLTPSQLLAADVNYDNVVTNTDSLLILQYVNGSISTFIDNYY